MSPEALKEWLTLMAGNPLLVACFVIMMRQLARQHREAMTTFAAMDAKLTRLARGWRTRATDPPLPWSDPGPERQTPGESVE